MRTLRKRNLRGGNTNFFTSLGNAIYDMFGMIAWFILALFSDKYASKSNDFNGYTWVKGEGFITMTKLKSKRSYD